MTLILPKTRVLILAGCGLFLFLACCTASNSIAAPQPGGDLVVERYAQLHRIELSEARARLARHSAAGRLQSDLRDELGTRFGGVWIEAETGEIQVGLAPGIDILSVRGSLASHGLLSDATIKPVFASERDLKDGQNRLLSQFGQAVSDGVMTLGIAPQDNAVIVEVTKDASKRLGVELENLERVSRTPVDLQVTNARSLSIHPSACSFPNCDRPLRGGVRIAAEANTTSGNGRCTAGFIARNPQTNVRYLMTAGHCLKPFPNALWYARSLAYGSRPINTSVSGGWAELQVGLSGDWGLIRISSNSFWNPTTLTGAFAHWGVNPDGARAQSKRESIVGEFQCRWGSYTYNGNACGNVLAKDVFSVYTDGRLVGGLTQTAGCSEAGDSGGPVYAANYTALGIHAGTSDETCSANPRYSYHTEVTRAESASGAQIVLGG